MRLAAKGRNQDFFRFECSGSSPDFESGREVSRTESGSQHSCTGLYAATLDVACDWRWFGSSSAGEFQADPAADGPGEQPRDPVPVGPAFGPVGDGSAEAHHFAEDKEPEDVRCGAAGSESGADPGAEDRDHDEEGGAREERRVSGDMAWLELPRKHAGEDGVGAEDEDDGERVASEYDSDGFEHRDDLRGHGPGWGGGAWFSGKRNAEMGSWAREIRLRRGLRLGFGVTSGA